MNIESRKLINLVNELQGNLEAANRTILHTERMLARADRYNKWINFYFFLVTLILPAFSIYTVIQVNDVEDKIRSEMATYIKDQNDLRVKRNLADINSNDKRVRVLAFNSLFLTQTILDAAQTEVLIAAHRNETNPSYRTSIMQILAIQDPVYIDKYFQYLLQNDVDPQQMTMISNYIFAYGEPSLERIESFFRSSNSKENFFYLMLQHARSYSFDVNKIFYSEEISNAMLDIGENQGNLNALLQSAQGDLTMIDLVAFKQTYFYLEGRKRLAAEKRNIPQSDKQKP